MEAGWVPNALWFAAALVFAGVGVRLFQLARNTERGAPAIRVVSATTTPIEAPADRVSVLSTDPALEVVEVPLVAAGPEPEPEPEAPVAAAEAPPVEAEYGVEPLLEPDVVPEAVADAEPEPAPEPAPPAPPAAPPLPALDLVWPTLVDPDAGALDEPTRQSMISGLALLGDAWAATILARAAGEEPGPLAPLARAALGPALERAYDTPGLADRFVAVALASRAGRTPLLARALADADLGVALAAARGLARAGRLDLVAEALAAAGDDPRSDEIRRVVAIPDDED